MFASALLSSQRPYTLLAAAKTAHLELRVVVIPAWEKKSHGLEFIKTDFVAHNVKNKEFDTIIIQNASVINILQNY